jgi:hypothetical protein
LTQIAHLLTDHAALAQREENGGCGLWSGELSHLESARTKGHNGTPLRPTAAEDFNQRFIKNAG